jgi:Flp pilus assembly protein CpaB
METNTVIVLFALVAALGLVGVVAVDILLTIQEVDAAPPPTQGCRNSIAVNASQARCFRG